MKPTVKQKKMKKSERKSHRTKRETLGENELATTGTNEDANFGKI